MKYDLTCECGKGIRLLRGDLESIACACGKTVKVPPSLRASLPKEFRSFAAAETPVEAPKGSGADRVFFSICWCAGIALAAVPFFYTSEDAEILAKAKADPTPGNVQAYLDRLPYGTRREDLLRLCWDKAYKGDDAEQVAAFLRDFSGEPSWLGDREEAIWRYADRVKSQRAYELYIREYGYSQHSDEARQALAGTGAPSGPNPHEEPPPQAHDDGPSGTTTDEGPSTPHGDGEDGDEGDGARINKQMEDIVNDQAQGNEATERADLAAFDANPTRDAAFAFLQAHPESSSRKKVSDALLGLLAADWTDRDGTPPPATLQQILAGRESNELTVSIDGFTSETSSGRIFETLKSQLAAIGVRVTQTPTEADIRVHGTESTDTTKTYNKLGLEGGPYAEDISVSIETWLPGAFEAACTASASTSSPGSVSYTVYNDVDVGPSQGDVHGATLDELQKSLNTMFQYR